MQILTPRPLRAALLACALLLLAAGAPSQQMPLAIAPAGHCDAYNLFSFDEASGVLTPGFQQVEFLPLQLEGYPLVDRLRLDRPALLTLLGAPTTHIRLPVGGALYRIGQPDSTSLMMISREGQMSLPLSVVDDGGGSALLTGVGVCADGNAALAATSPGHGGNVWWIDLAGDSAPVDLTANLPPLPVEAVSLRLGPDHAWFVAAGVLYRAELSDGTGAAPLDLGPALAGQPVQPEIALSAFAGRVAAVVGADPLARSLVSVSGAGEVSLLSDTPADYDTPHYDHPLGPWLTVSPDGGIVAWRRTIGGSVELFAQEVDLPSASLHVTQAPSFPAYIDNVGVLSFRFDRLLLFFTGDTTLAGPLAPGTLGAGDMYAADMTVPGAPVYTNVSLSSGGYEPPYNNPSGLYLSQAAFDPLGQHCIISGIQPDGTEALSTFPVYPLGGTGGVDTHLTGLEDAPVLELLGERLLVSSEPPNGVAPPPSGPETQIDLGVLDDSGQGGLGLSSLLSIPDGVEIDRETADHDGLWTAFVVHLDSDLELPALLSADTGAVLLPTWPLLLGVSPAMAFSSSGRLYFAMGLSDGPARFVSVQPGSAPSLIATPKGHGFPLAH